LLVKGLRLLKDERKPFNKPVYDKFLKVRTEQTVTVTPVPVIIVEGALIFCQEQLRDLFDLSVYIDTDDDVRLSRRVLKNAQTSDQQQVSLAELLRTYEEKTKPAFEKFIEPTKKYANTIIPNYGFSTDKLELDKMTI
jgi:uridine kinase